LSRGHSARAGPCAAFLAHQSGEKYLNPDYAIARDPDAANGVPYELSDEPIARAKVRAAAAVARWVESLIRS